MKILYILIFSLIITKYPFIFRFLTPITSNFIFVFSYLFLLLNIEYKVINKISNKYLLFFLLILIFQLIQLLVGVKANLIQIQFLINISLYYIFSNLSYRYSIVEKILAISSKLMICFAYFSVFFFIIFFFGIDIELFKFNVKENIVFFFPFTFGKDVNTLEHFRLQSYFTEPAVASFMFSISYFICDNFKVYVINKKLDKFSLLFSIFFTLSISGIISFILAFIIYTSKNWKFLIIMFLLSLFIFVKYIVLPNEELILSSNNYIYSNLLQSYYNRIFIYKNNFDDLFIFGRGIGNDYLFAKEIRWEDVSISRFSSGGSVTGLLSYINDFGILSIPIYFFFISNYITSIIFYKNNSFIISLLTLIIIFSLSTDLLFTSPLVIFILVLIFDKCKKLKNS